VTTRIAFLRAVNLGKRQVRMSRAVEVLEELGYGDVWSYINSGNLVFDASGSRTAIEVKKALALEPFRLRAGDTYFITFLKKAPAAATAKALEAASNDFDTLVVDGREVHWRMRGKSTDTKLKAKDWRPLGEFGSTSRNVNMLGKLGAKLDG
jgi:uncharacterized protein (DUF1697 family)